MRILVVFTGGTIDSTINNGFADIGKNPAAQLLRLCSRNADFECVSPFSILSENANCSTLSDLCSFMLNVDYSLYDGVIVTHGSDTLAYSSAMLGLVLSWVEIPVVITAANYPLSMPQSNGNENFNAALDFIADFANGCHKNTGVFTVWKNDDEPVNVHIACRLNQADNFLDSFSSYCGVPCGIVSNGHFIRTESVKNPLFAKPCRVTEFLRGKKLRFNNNVLLLHSYVGLDFNALSLKGKSAVLLKLYHSATFCSQGENTSFPDFVSRCCNENVDVYVYPAKKSDYLYGSSKNLDDKKIRFLYNVNTPAAYAKLLLAYNIEPEKQNFIINFKI